MGEHDIPVNEVAGGALHQFMAELLNDLRALEEIIDSGLIERSKRRIGAEQELFLVDRMGLPACKALEVLERADDPHFTTELGLFNLEINLDPLLFGGDVFTRLRAQLEELLALAEAGAREVGARPLLVGILPTLLKSDLGMESMTPAPRYLELNRVLNQMRGGPSRLQIQGADELTVTHDNILLEACTCSYQLHLQVTPEEFPSFYNAAQLASAPVLAAAVNSPFLFERNLWRETRIALFQQAVDIRRTSTYLRDQSPRVTFGESWVKRSALEIFQEDITRFRAVFGSEGYVDPFAALARGEAPALKALSLHSGTIWRWNRACYGVTDGKPHLRIENRVLPSGPTVTDEIANAAFWYGLLFGLVAERGDVAAALPFASARTNFHQAARYGLSATFDWLDGERLPARELILERLLPLAAEGLRSQDIDGGAIERELGVVRRRVESGRTGARWMIDSLAGMNSTRRRSVRFGALTLAMIERQASGQAVADWEPAGLEDSGDWRHGIQKVEQIMTTDLFTVQRDEPLGLVARIMDWRKIRHILVENEQLELVGLVSYRALIRAISRGRLDENVLGIPVSSVMKEAVLTIEPEAPTLQAIRIMRERRIGCLPVVKEGRLVGIVTERDFMEVSGRVLEEQLAGEAELGEDRAPGS